MKVNSAIQILRVWNGCPSPPLPSSICKYLEFECLSWQLSEKEALHLFNSSQMSLHYSAIRPPPSYDCFGSQIYSKLALHISWVLCLPELNRTFFLIQFTITACYNAFIKLLNLELEKGCPIIANRIQRMSFSKCSYLPSKWTKCFVSVNNVQLNHHKISPQNFYPSKTFE